MQVIHGTGWQCLASAGISDLELSGANPSIPQAQLGFSLSLSLTGEQAEPLLQQTMEGKVLFLRGKEFYSCTLTTPIFQLQ